MNYQKKVEDFCLEKGNYKIFRTLTGVNNLSALIRFNFHKNRKAIAANIMNTNVILRSIA